MKVIVTVDAATGDVLETYGPVSDDLTLPAITGRVRLDRPVGEDHKFKQWDGSAFKAAPTSRVLSRSAFARLFTQAERIAIRKRVQVGDATAEVMTDFYSMLEFEDQVDLTDSEVLRGLNLLQSLSLITGPRKAQILANERPNG